MAGWFVMLFCRSLWEESGVVTHTHGTHTHTHTHTHTQIHTHASDGHSRKRASCCGQATAGYLEVIRPVAGPVWSRLASL